MSLSKQWHSVMQLVEAINCRPDSRGFYFRWCHNINPPPRYEPGFDSTTQPVTKLSSSPVTGPDGPRGFQEVKVPRFRDNGTG